MRVAVRPFVQASNAGGVLQYIQGLVRALGRLDGSDQVDLLARGEDEVWLDPYLDGTVDFVRTDTGRPTASLTRRARESVAYRAGHVIKRRLRATLAQVPASDGFAEARGYDVVHYPTPYALDTVLPFVYQPWDLQHRHFPDFFTTTELKFRELNYRHFSEKAAMVIVASSFVKDDVIDAFALSPERVAVVAAASPLELSNRLSPDEAQHFIRARAIPARFALYPAYGWPHKNHMRLVEAVAILKGRGITVPLVCSGHTTEHTDAAARRAAELGVDDVMFLGRVSAGELLSLYDRAECLVFPSLFEGFGLPVLEGFAAGLPVACSNTTSLPELAGDAAMLFDPLDPSAIADALEVLWLDDGRRARLIEGGRKRAARYTWDRVAEETVRVYREATRVGSHG